eukprot:2577767-Amphidinium_carterae.1
MLGLRHGPQLVSDEDIDAIWQREHSAGSFAVNAGCGESHWVKNMEMYKVLNNGEVPHYELTSEA